MLDVNYYRYSSIAGPWRTASIGPVAWCTIKAWNVDSVMQNPFKHFNKKTGRPWFRVMFLLGYCVLGKTGNRGAKENACKFYGVFIVWDISRSKCLPINLVYIKRILSNDWSKVNQLSFTVSPKQSCLHAPRVSQSCRFHNDLDIKGVLWGRFEGYFL